MPISTIGSNSLNQTSDLTINGVTVGKGAGSNAYNTTVGSAALAGSNTGANNTAIGYGTLFSNTSGASGTAVGTSALLVNSTGSYNTAVGHQALTSNTTASYNTALGYQAGYTNITGANTTYVGYQAGLFATGNYNTAFGSGTGKGGNGTNTGTDNTTYGYAAGSNLTSGSGNTLIGDNAGAFVTTGTANTFIGGGIVGSTGGSGFYVSTGSKNAILGCYNGNQDGLDIRTGSNYIVLSDGDGNVRYFYGLRSGATGHYFLAMINSAGNFPMKWNSTTGAMSYDTSSRLVKENIIDSPYGLAEIMQLKSRKYFRTDDQRSEVGLVADEVTDILPELVPMVPKSVFTKNEEDTEVIAGGVNYDKLTSVLVKAIQELKTIVDAQAAEIVALKAKVA
jgi:hypothetical protein